MCNVKITENLALFGLGSTVTTDIIFDLTILLAKQYLFQIKFEKCVPLVSVFRKQLQERYMLEEQNPNFLSEAHVFNTQWHYYKPLLLDNR